MVSGPRDMNYAAILEGHVVGPHQLRKQPHLFPEKFSDQSTGDMHRNAHSSTAVGEESEVS